MALQKEITMPNGIVTTYHRITSMSFFTNVNIFIEVNSYVSKAKREEEDAYYMAKKKKYEGALLTLEEQQLIEKGINVFIDADYIAMPYSEETNIKSAYEYLKTLDKFKGAESV